ncbi:MAG: carboxypeptidase regulatory-like domain-containing protein [Rhodospirillales bacterium]|nr:carboxypeptidase regulatory-like domain-containing protein [Rhodospirillales bacterium]
MVVSPARGAGTPEPEEWIFSVVMPPQWTITNAIFAYQFKGGYYLPIVELGAAFEFYTEAETGRAFVTGFAGREENAFTLDGEQGELVVKGERVQLPVDGILVSDLVPDDDIYVRLDVINLMWPVELEVDLPSITIIAEAEEELSFIRRKERENRQEIFKSQQALRDRDFEDLTYVENSYKWIGKPILDLQSTYTYDMDGRRFAGTNTISGTQQLAKFITDFSASYRLENGGIQRPDSIRTRFSRQAPEGENLFIPTVRRVDFGDVSLSQRDLVGSNSGGRGVTVSNTDNSRSREFDRITIEGRGPPGWELELYKNNQLIRIGAVEDDGEYYFEDVALSYGNNRMRVILYGPQGQIREDVYEYDIGNSLLSPGEVQYNLGIVDTDRPFFRLEEPDPNDDEPLLTKKAEMFYGLNQWLTLFGSYTQTPYDKEEEKYYTGGFVANTPVGVAEVEGYRQINGGNAVDMRFLTELLGMRLNLRTAFFNKFESQNAGEGTGAKSFEAEADINTKLPLPFIPMDLRLNLLHRELVDGTVTTTAETAQSFTGGGLRFNNSTTSRFVNEIHEASSGSTNINWNKGNWQTRGGFVYNLSPEAELQSGTMEVRYKSKDAFQTSINMQHDFSNSTFGAGAQVGYDFDDLLTTFDAQYREERGWQFILRASTSINPYNADRNYKLSSASKKSTSPVLGHVFLDRNGDGVYNEGDEPVQGARLQVGRSPSRELSDESGYVVVPVQPDRLNAVSLDEGSLKDPYYRSVTTGYSTVGLRGAMPGFEFPIVETGAIDGTVWNDSTGAPVGGMRLELVKPDGEVYMTTETAFDGYYAFEFVLPGTYTVRADPSYQVDVPPETVEVSSEELFAFGIDLYLLEPAAEESAAAETDGDSGGIAQLPTTAPAVPGTEQPAPVSLPGGGSSPAAEETSDEDSSPAVESSVDEGSSFVGESDSSGGAASIVPTPEPLPDVVPVTGQVSNIRIGEHPDKVRVVLELSEKAEFRIEEGDSGMVVIVDMPSLRWNTNPSDTLPYNMTLKGFGTERLPNGGTRLLLVARDTMIVKDHQELPAGEGRGPRFFIDVARP